MGAISIVASDSPGSAGVKAKPYGRPAAGLDPGAIMHMGTFSVAAISKWRVRQYHSTTPQATLRLCRIRWPGQR
jgi:hypothetical protein